MYAEISFMYEDIILNRLESLKQKMVLKAATRY